jgi:hypothetical protein
MGRYDDDAGGAAKVLACSLNVVSHYVVSISESIKLSSSLETHRFYKVSGSASR